MTAAISALPVKKLNYFSATPQFANTCLDDVDLLSILGKSSNYKRVLVRHKKTHVKYAMQIYTGETSKKVIKKMVESPDKFQELTEKIAYLNQCPFFSKIYAIFTNSNMEKLFVLYEFISGGELFFHLQRNKYFSSDCVRFFAAELFLVVEQFHKYGVVGKLSLRPENVVIDALGHVCLTDFDALLLLEFLHEKQLFKQKQEPIVEVLTEYIPPECLQGDAIDVEIKGEACDWWQFGNLLYEFLTGLPPFYNHNASQMYKQILNHSVEFPKQRKCDSDIMSLIEGLLEKNPFLRLGTGSASEIKKHVFFTSIDWKKLEEKELNPPFVPKIKQDEEEGIIDGPLPIEPPIDSSIENADLVDSEGKPIDPFAGFTYTPQLNEK